MKKIILLFGLLFALLLAVVLSKNYVSQEAPSIFKKTATITIKEKEFNPEVAETPEEKQIGLSQRNSIDENEGMIFKFEKPDYYSFWMKNMRFPIDIIFIKENKITTIYKFVDPPKTENESLQVYQPKEPSDIVLELKEGTSDKYGFKEGDVVKIENLGN